MHASQLFSRSLKEYPILETGNNETSGERVPKVGDQIRPVPMLQNKKNPKKSYNWKTALKFIFSSFIILESRLQLTSLVTMSGDYDKGDSSFPLSIRATNALIAWPYNAITFSPIASHATDT